MKMWRIAILFSCTVLFLFTFRSLHSGESSVYEVQISPHTDALQLVFLALEKKIQHLDPSSKAWYDTQERQWTVKRPYGPGFIDSTHIFDVHYKIDGKVVLSCFVDTRRRTVEEQVLSKEEKSKTDAPAK